MLLSRAAINDAQGWCRVMTYIESVLVGSVVLGGLRSPGHGHHRTGAGLDLSDDAGGHRSPDDVVAAVVLAGDAVEGLDVDDMGSADGRLQLGAAGNAAEHGSHRPVICCVTGIVVKAPPDSLVVCPNPLPSALSSRLLSIGMEWISMHCLPIHSIVNAFHRNGIHTIGMDTNGVDAHGVAAAGGRVAGTTWLFPW